MKSKLKIILTGITMLAVVFVLQAQRGQGQQTTPEQRAEKQTTMMTEKLSLSADQAAKVKAINLKYAEKQQSKRGEAKGEREKQRSSMQQLQNERKAEINAVLNKDQQAKFEKFQEETGPGRAGKAGYGKGKGDRTDRATTPEEKAGRMTQRMTDELSLTKDQVAKVQAINLDFAKQKQALQQKTGDNQKPNRSAMDKLKKDHSSQLKKVLDKGQFEKWEQKAPRGKKDFKGKGKMKHQGTDQ